MPPTLRRSRGRRFHEPAEPNPTPIPARPRPHHPHHRLPPPQAQDAGLHRRMRLIIIAPASPTRSGWPRSPARWPVRCARRRGSRGSDRAGPRFRPPALRPYRRGCAARHAMAKLMGGFDHNAQSLRVVTKLERRYAEFDSLNLTWETLEGLVKHNGPLIGCRREKASKRPRSASRSAIFRGALRPLTMDSDRRPRGASARRLPTTSPTTHT